MASTTAVEYENGDEIIRRWSPAIVLLSYLTSFMSAYASVRLLDHANWKKNRKSRVEVTTDVDDNVNDSSRKRNIISSLFLKYPNIVAPVVLGFGTVWSMHFIGMSAVTLDGVPYCFDWWTTILSLFLVILFMCTGVYVVSFDVFANPDKLQKLEALLIHDRRVTDKKNKRKANFAIHSTAFFHQPWYIIAAGLLAATGALLMHYLGMIAMKGPFVKKWNFLIVAASIVLAVVVCCVGFFIIFRVLHWKVETYWLRPCGAAVIAFAVCSMHYCGEFSVHYLADDSRQDVCGYSTKDASPNAWTNHQILVVVVCMLTPLIAFSIESNISHEIIMEVSNDLNNFTLDVASVAFSVAKSYSEHLATTKRKSITSRKVSYSQQSIEFEIKECDEEVSLTNA